MALSMIRPKVILCLALLWGVGRLLQGHEGKNSAISCA